MADDVKLIMPGAKLAPSPLLDSTTKTSAAAGTVMTLLLGFGIYCFGATEPTARGDQVSNSEAARLAEAFRHGRGSLLPVDLSSEARRDELIRALRMPKAEAEQLMAMVERGERMLGWLILWDNFDEDGDVASVTAGGFTQRVPLAHAPVRILVPYIPGRPVIITGERDGMGGGVTLAVELTTGPLPLPPLAVGQTIALPIQ